MKEYIFPTSVMTGFHSGYIGQGRKKDDIDYSLIPKMNKKTVIIKDADTLLTTTGRDRILGELRDIFDGVTRSNYRTGKSKQYEGLRITFILCGTGSLRSLNRSFLGERFLDCVIYEGEDIRPYVDKAFDLGWRSFTESIDSGEEWQVPTVTKAATYGFVQHLKSIKHQAPIMPDASAARIKGLAGVLAYLRAKVVREGSKEELSYRPEIEIPTRITLQLTKLAGSLALVLGRDSIDDEVMRIVQKVVKDTGKGFHCEIVDYLFLRAGGAYINEIVSALNSSNSAIDKHLKDMREFKMIEEYESPNPSGIIGRTPNLYRLTSAFRQVYETAFGPAVLRDEGAAGDASRQQEDLLLTEPPRLRIRKQPRRAEA